LADKLSALGHQASVSDAQAGGVLMHKVRIGPFATWRAARDEADRLDADQTLDRLTASPKK
jgi:hypothetical protein